MATSSQPVFEMSFEPMAIEHLGLRLYSTLPPVIAEFVTNAYDAEAPKVEVTLPSGPIDDKSEVRVRDYGIGMSADEIRAEFLPIGRNRRGPSSTNTKSKNGLRTVTGRKGLGKLSAFGVADEMEVRSVQNGSATTLRLRYSEMQDWPKTHPGQPYRATFIADRSGPTTDATGVDIILRKLRRTRAINSDVLRSGLARRLHLIKSGFVVLVDGKGIQPGDRVRRSDCVDTFSWKASELPDGGQVGSHAVTGWVGFVQTSSQAADRGVDIFAHDKAVELGSYFNYASTHAQFARAHLVGELHADFLDEGEDLVSTARTQVVWETGIGQVFQEWGQKMLAWAFEQWVTLRKTEKEEKVIKAAQFDVWLKDRPAREQRIANKMVKLLVDEPTLDPEAAKPLLEIVKASVETLAFQELVDNLEDGTPTIQTLLRVFDEWRIIEAREHLQMAEGRQASLDQLAKYMEDGALEVQEIQPLIEKNLWLVDPRWHVAYAQPKYSQMLRSKFAEKASIPDEDKRLDIMGVTNGGELTVLELKRPERTLNRDDLEQLETYVDWARENIGSATGPDAVTSVRGLLVGGKILGGTGMRAKIERLAGDDIRLETYADLHKLGTTFYLYVEQQLSKIAPEYVKRKKKLKKS